ncbi:MAG: PQQ-binding-like beta-propeller repeat protein [Steroidobacteraceae bacterium]
MMSPAAIFAALTHGMMVEEGKPLTMLQKREVAEYLSGQRFSAVRQHHPLLMCKGAAAKFDLAQAPVPYGWGHNNSRFIPAGIAQLPLAAVPNLKLKWAFAFPGALRARSQPAIAYGAVYVGSQNGTVYALDLANGCVRWTYRARSEVRTGMVLATASDHDHGPHLYFGDIIGNVYAVNPLTGKLQWRRKVSTNPNATLTGTPALYDGTLYVPVSSLEEATAAAMHKPCCSFRGSVVALNGETGAVRWRTFTIPTRPRIVGKTRIGVDIFAPSGAPVWNSPTVDPRRGVLYVATGDNYTSPADDMSDAVLAMRLSDGKILWHRQLLAHDAWNVACMFKGNPNCPRQDGPDADFGASVILTTLPNGRQILLAGQKSGIVYGLDPNARGRIEWRQRVGRGGVQGGIEFGMTAYGGRVFVPISDMKNGHDGRTYQSPPRPGLYALNAANGRILWSRPAAHLCHGRAFCDPGIAAAITSIPGVVFAGHLDGMLGAYSARNGKSLWRYNALRTFKTVSGASAKGGSFDGPGAVVRDGYVVIDSGYGLYFHMPGNVLLVFKARLH